MKLKTRTIVSEQDWSELVRDVYCRPYCLQQQNGCMNRGTINITIPNVADESKMDDSVPEIVNGGARGVKFAKWIERDPKQPLSENEELRTDQWAINLWWDRNFYPNLQTVANDLHAKGHVDAGNYTIDIDW